MAVPVVENFAVTNVQGEDQLLTAPTGTQEDEILVVFVSMDGADAALTVDGFTSVSNVQQGLCEQFILIKRAGPSEPASYLAEWIGNERGRATMFRVSGCPTTGTAFDQVDQIGALDSGTSTAAFCPAITSTVIDTLALAGLTADAFGVQAGDGFDTPNGFVVEGTPGNNGNIGAGGIIGSKDLPSIGSSLSPEFGWTDNEQYVTNMINLIGISAAPPTRNNFWQGPIPQPIF